MPAVRLEAGYPEPVDGQFGHAQVEPIGRAFHFHYRVTFDMTRNRNEKLKDTVSWFSTTSLKYESCSVGDFEKRFKHNAERYGGPPEQCAVNLEFELDDSTQEQKVENAIRGRVVGILRIMRPVRILLEVKYHYQPRRSNNRKDYDHQNGERSEDDPRRDMIIAHEIAAICYDEAVDNHMYFDVDVLPPAGYGRASS